LEGRSDRLVDSLKSTDAPFGTALLQIVRQKYLLVLDPFREPIAKSADASFGTAVLQVVMQKKVVLDSFGEPKAKSANMMMMMMILKSCLEPGLTHKTKMYECSNQHCSITGCQTTQEICLS
jgi:hypothetical protein